MEKKEHETITSLVKSGMPENVTLGGIILAKHSLDEVLRFVWAEGIDHPEEKLINHFITKYMIHTNISIRMYRGPYIKCDEFILYCGHVISVLETTFVPSKDMLDKLLILDYTKNKENAK